MPTLTLVKGPLDGRTITPPEGTTIDYIELRTLSKLQVHRYSAVVPKELDKLFWLDPAVAHE